MRGLLPKQYHLFNSQYYSISTNIKSTHTYRCSNKDCSSNKQYGFNLLEVVIAISIVGVLAVASIPSFISLIDQFNARVSLDNLRTKLLSARNLALITEQPVTVCALKNNQCQSDWSEPLAIFYDEDSDLTRDPHEHLVLQQEGHSRRGQWRKKKAISQPYVRYTTQGYSIGSATTFLFCLDSGNLEAARYLVLSRQGRIRAGKYIDSNGRPPKNMGGLQCD